MKLRKAKRFHTIESYANCVCAWSTCSCSCGGCVCACRGVEQPLDKDHIGGRADVKNYNATKDSMSNTSYQNLGL